MRVSWIGLSLIIWTLLIISQYTHFQLQRLGVQLLQYRQFEARHRQLIDLVQYNACPLTTSLLKIRSPSAVFVQNVCEQYSTWIFASLLLPVSHLSSNYMLSHTLSPLSLFLYNIQYNSMCLERSHSLNCKRYFT